MLFETVRLDFFIAERLGSVAGAYIACEAFALVHLVNGGSLGDCLRVANVIEWPRKRRKATNCRVTNHAIRLLTWSIW